MCQRVERHTEWLRDQAIRSRRGSYKIFFSIPFYCQVEKILLTILSAKEDRETRSTGAVHNGESTSELNAVRSWDEDLKLEQ